jgi:predicted amidohydrolase YtcJ
VWQPDGSFKESFGIKGNHIDFTGSLKDAQNIKDNYQKTIDLEGKLVLPSFTDGHVHLVYGSLMSNRIDCYGIKTPQQLREKVLIHDEEFPDKSWLVGGNLDIGTLLKNFTEGSRSAMLFLDAVSEKPLFIFNYDYHSAICNSTVLENTGLYSKIRDYDENELPKDFEGKPVGIIREKAMDYIRARIPEPTLQERIDAVDKMIGVMHSFGITSVSDITLIQNLEVYKSLHKQNKLKIRINSYLPFNEFDNLKKYEDETSEIPKELFSIKGFKAYYDGALGSETGLFKENYKKKDYNGYKTEMAESEKIIELAKKIDKAGKQIIIHAIGDKAVAEVLDIAEVIASINGPRDRRLRIEHAQHIDKADFGRFKDLNVIASVQPLHMKYDIKIVIEKLPDTIVKRTHNYKALMDRGVVVNFGSDFPIVEINPFENIKLAVTRESEGKVFLPEYKINMHNSIKAYTINNAYASFNESTSGKIEPGKFADFVIMEDNLFEIPEDEISTARVKSTYFDGEEVYNLNT